MKLENKNVVLLESGAHIATNSTPEQVNRAHTAVHVIIDVTDITASPSVVPTIEAVDRISGKSYVLLTGAAIIATGTTVLKVYPGAVAVANLVADDSLPLIWKVVMTHDDADSIEYSISANLM